jgi:hypothetical protein
MIDDSKQCLNNLFFSSVRHIKREANKVVHDCMAKLSNSQLLDEEWIGECPLFLQAVILAHQEVFG